MATEILDWLRSTFLRTGIRNYVLGQVHLESGPKRVEDEPRPAAFPREPARSTKAASAAENAGGPPKGKEEGPWGTRLGRLGGAHHACVPAPETRLGWLAIVGH
jgi:hypothetical protein